MGMMGVNSWGKLVRSPWRLSIWATGIPLIIATGFYGVERLDDRMVDSGYAESGLTACTPGTYLQGIVNYYGDTTGTSGTASVEGDHRCPSVIGGAVWDSSAFTAYVGDVQAEMSLHPSVPYDGKVSGRAIIGVVGTIGPDGTPVVRTFCVGTNDHRGFSGTAEYAHPELWGRGWGPAWDNHAFLSGMDGTNPIVLPREEVEHAEAWMGKGMQLPQKACSEQKLETSTLVVGESSCQSDDCQARHRVHEARRLTKWLRDHGAR